MWFSIGLFAIDFALALLPAGGAGGTEQGEGGGLDRAKPVFLRISRVPSSEEARLSSSSSCTTTTTTATAAQAPVFGGDDFGLETADGDEEKERTSRLRARLARESAAAHALALHRAIKDAHAIVGISSASHQEAGCEAEKRGAKKFSLFRRLFQMAKENATQQGGSTHADHLARARKTSFTYVQ